MRRPGHKPARAWLLWFISIILPADDGQNLRLSPDKPRILKLSMLHPEINSSCTPADGAAKRPGPQVGADTLALIIPTLNEAENLPGLLRRVRSALDPVNIPYEVLIVDDNSCDGTEQIVAAIAREDAHVRLLVRMRERYPETRRILLTGYIMDGRYGFSRVMDEKSALTFHRMLHLPLIVLVLVHSVPAVYLAMQRWGWIKHREDL